MEQPGLLYNRLILENSIKITKVKLMRRETDKIWLYEWYNDYTTIEYQIVIQEKAGVSEIKTKLKCLQWDEFCNVSATKK